MLVSVLAGTETSIFNWTLNLAFVFLCSDRRNKGSPMKNTKHIETASSIHATGVIDCAEDTVLSGNIVQASVAVNHQSGHFNNSIYASVQQTSEAVEMSESVVYAELDFPKKDQQKAKSAAKIAACLSSIYSDPYQPPGSSSNREYAAPFKADKTPKAIAPVLNDLSAED